MRHDGYYWVKMGIFWEIAHWNGAAEHWTIHGEDGRFSDGCWSGINERRIERGSEQQLSEYAEDMLRLIGTVKYLSGIAEKGEGRAQSENETVEQFVLGYVQRLEQQRDELLAALKCIDRELTNMQPHIPQACYPNKQGFIDDYVDIVLVLVRTVIAKAAQAGEGN